MPLRGQTARNAPGRVPGALFAGGPAVALPHWASAIGAAPTVRQGTAPTNRQSPRPCPPAGSGACSGVRTAPFGGAILPR
jgi:hypothetical protein